MKKNDFSILLAFCMLFLTFRLVMLFSNIIFFYDFTAAPVAKLAKDILTLNKSWSVFSNIFDYQFLPIDGGSLLVSILYLPFAIFFGVNTFSYQLVVLCIGCITFIIWYLFLHKFFGRTAALLFGALFCINSPIFNTWSLITSGFYAESALFVVWGLFFLCNRLQHASDNSKKAQSNSFFILFGILCGFSLYFNYSYLVAIVTFITLWLIKSTSNASFLKKRYIALFIGGFCIGFSPWILAHISGATEPLLYIHGFSLKQIFFQKNTLELLKDLKFTLFNMPNMPPSYTNDYVFSMLPFYARAIADNIYRVAGAIAFISTIIVQLKNKKINYPLLGILLYIAIFTFVFGMIHPELQYPRHQVPIYPFMFALIAIAIGWLIQPAVNIWIKRAGTSMYVILLGISFLDNVNLIRPSNIKNPFNFNGHEYAYFLKVPFLAQGYKQYLDKHIEFRKRNNQPLEPLMLGFLHIEDVVKHRIEQSDLHWAQKAEMITRYNIERTLNRMLSEGTPNIENWGWGIGIIYRWDIERCIDTIQKLQLHSPCDLEVLYYSLGLGIASLDKIERDSCMNAVSRLTDSIKQPIVKAMADF
jgi:4-amino-4-deoxy-L-arabinose transferase-like glycosyltransferase